MVLLIIGVLINLFSQGGSGISADSLSEAEREFSFRTVTNEAFMHGESLLFDISYGIIRAGEGEMIIPEISRMNNRDCYRIEFKVRSVSPFSWVYRVDDRWETYIDKNGIFPWRFSLRIREGGYSRDFAVDFDQVNNKAVTKKGEYEIPPYVHDVISALYYIRTVDFSDFEPGQRVSLKNFYNDSTYALDVVYHGREEVKVKTGTFRTIRVEPLVREGGLFKHDGAIFVWLTDDKLRVPVRVSTRIPLGSITAELKQYSGLRDAIRARIQ
jgi:hypothetical protein